MQWYHLTEIELCSRLDDGDGVSDCSFFADVHTVKELTDILVLDQARLVDQGCRAGDLFDVVALQNQLVLVCSAAHNADAVQHRHPSDPSFSQKVTDLDYGCASVLGQRNVDGEVRIGKPHLVLEALSDTHDHVLDVSCNCSQAGKLLPVAIPHVHTHQGRSDHVGCKADSLEGAHELSPGPLHGYCTSGHTDSDCNVNKISICNNIPAQKARGRIKRKGTTYRKTQALGR